MITTVFSADNYYFEAILMIIKNDNKYNKKYNNNISYSTYNSNK